ncbi:MAG: DUF2169 family type VI secretion system accessory protein [Geminicoccaceae bacterium]
MEAGYTMGIDPSAREHVVVAVKGTFAIPDDQGPAPLAEQQAPLVMADEFWGEPGFSSPRYEVDYALRKPRCDLLVNGSAHAPHGQPADKVQVAVKLGRWFKTFNVVGDRIWEQRGATLPSVPERFATMPITYDRAFGGVDDVDPHDELPDSYGTNPVGRGWHRQRNRSRVFGHPVANTEAIRDPIREPWGGYQPQGFGVIGRNWKVRYPFAGTYDQDWIDHTFPFLPADFDDRYYQAAPEDQQIAPPQGGEKVQLLNLTPEGRTRFLLPTVDVPVVFFRKNQDPTHHQAVLDTIVIEPDLGRVLMTWRASVPLRRNMFEMTQVLVGTMSRAWWRARELGKTYYPGLGAMVREKRSANEEELV